MPYREEPIDQARVDALRAKQLAVELDEVVEVGKQLQTGVRDAQREVGDIQTRITALNIPRYGGLMGWLLFRPDKAAIARETRELVRAQRAVQFAETLVEAAHERARAIQAELARLPRLAGEPDARAAAAALAAGVAAALGTARDLRGAMRELAATAQQVLRAEMAYALGNTDKEPQGLAGAEQRQAHARSRLLLARATLVPLGPLAGRGADWVAGFDEALRHVTAAGNGPGAEWCDHLVRASKAIDAVVADLERTHQAAPATSGA